MPLMPFPALRVHNRVATKSYMSPDFKFTDSANRSHLEPEALVVAGSNTPQEPQFTGFHDN